MATPRKPPAASGKKGDYTTTSANDRGGNKKIKYWYHNGTDWEKTTETNYNNRSQTSELDTVLSKFSAPTDNYMSASLRYPCLLYTSPSPRDATLSRMPSSA